MNGNDLLEAMSFLDDQYIDEAEAEPKKRRLYWQPAFAAAAACLALVLAGVWKTLPQQQEAPAVGASLYRVQETEAAVSGARAMEEPAANQADAAAAAPMMASVFARMTVQVVEQTEDAFVCIVTDPGTSGYEIRQQVTIVLPETTAATDSAAAEAATESAETLYQVTFDPGEAAEVITAIEWTPME